MALAMAAAVPACMAAPFLVAFVLLMACSNIDST
jgi:hypothetical protein